MKKAPTDSEMMLRLHPACVRWLCLGLLFASCSKEPNPPKPPAPKAEIRQEGEKTVVTVAETGDQLVFGATDVPENFPRDLPIFPEARLRSHFTANSTILASFFTTKTPEELKPFYLEGSRLQDQGWEIDQCGQQGLTFTIDMHKGDRRSMITLTQTRNPAGTNISYIAKLE